MRVSPQQVVTADGSALPTSRDFYSAASLNYVFTGNTTLVSDAHMPSNLIFIYGGAYVSAGSSTSSSSTTASTTVTNSLSATDRGTVTAAMTKCAATSVTTSTSSLTEYTACLFRTFKPVGGHTLGSSGSSSSTTAAGSSRRLLFHSPGGPKCGLGGDGDDDAAGSSTTESSTVGSSTVGAAARKLQQATDSLSNVAFIAVWQPGETSRLSSKLASAGVGVCDV